MYQIVKIVISFNISATWDKYFGRHERIHFELRLLTA